MQMPILIQLIGERTTSNEQVYVRLPANVSAENINKQLFNSVKNITRKIKQVIEQIFCNRLSEIHFDDRFGNFGDHVTSKSTLWTLSLDWCVYYCYGLYQFYQSCYCAGCKSVKRNWNKKSFGKQSLESFLANDG